MKPINKYIIVTTSKEVEETSNGLLLSPEQQSQMRYGKAVVDEVGTMVDVVSKGDEIYFDKRRSFSLLVRGKQHTVITESDLIAVV